MAMSNLNFPTLIAVFLIAATDGTPACENGWVAYKDELCIKSLNVLETYQVAQDLCLAQGDPSSKPSLVMVKESGVQDLLANYTNTVFDNVWLGGQYDNASSQFRWVDGDPITYTNWQEGYPRNITDSDACIEMWPLETKQSIKAQGKWIHVTCRKRNLVICQKNVQWSLADIVNELISVRKELASTKEELNDVSKRVVPVGSIYVEYSGQPNPAALWPRLTWQDITGSYAGLFFRASGGGSEAWGVTQAECFTRLNWREYGNLRSGNYPYSMQIPASGWSEWFNAGEVWLRSGSTADRRYEAMRLHTEMCENRPKNQAIRIWKRTA